FHQHRGAYSSGKKHGHEFEGSDKMNKNWYPTHFLIFMTKKNKPDIRGYVYSTDPEFRFEGNEVENRATLSPAEQKMLVLLDSKQRAGKAVTLVSGFIGQTADLEDLGKKLKAFCGTGGSVKENEIIIQGDQRKKVMQWLLQNGYKRSR